MLVGDLGFAALPSFCRGIDLLPCPLCPLVDEASLNTIVTTRTSHSAAKAAALLAQLLLARP